MHPVPPFNPPLPTGNVSLNWDNVLGVLEIIWLGGFAFSSSRSRLLLCLLLPFFFPFLSLVCPEEIQNRLTGSHTRTHDEVDTKGSLVGCPHYAAVVFFLFVFFLSFLTLCLVRRHFGFFSHSRGSSLGDPFLTFISGLKIPLRLCGFCFVKPIC